MNLPAPYANYETTMSKKTSISKFPGTFALYPYVNIALVILCMITASIGLCIFAIGFAFLILNGPHAVLLTTGSIAIIALSLLGIYCGRNYDFFFPYDLKKLGLSLHINDSQIELESNDIHFKNLDKYVQSELNELLLWANIFKKNCSSAQEVVAATKSYVTCFVDTYNNESLQSDFLKTGIQLAKNTLKNPNTDNIRLMKKHASLLRSGSPFLWQWISPLMPFFNIYTYFIGTAIFIMVALGTILYFDISRENIRAFRLLSFPLSLGLYKFYHTDLNILKNDQNLKLFRSYKNLIRHLMAVNR